MTTNFPMAQSAEDQVLRRRLSGEGAGLDEVRARSSGSPAPLSSDQRRLWFINQLNPRGVEYNVDAAYRIRGPLDAHALADAVRATVARHEVLRSHVSVVGGEPYQIVDEPAASGLSRHDLSAEADPEAAAVTLARDEAERRFDLRQGPLFRAWLARLADDDHVFGVTVHHLVFDRDSLEILLGEVSAAYAQLRRGRPLARPPLPVQFADVEAWQRQHSTQAQCDLDRGYWRERLRNVPIAVELPADRPRPAHPTYAAGEIPVRVPPATADALRALASAHRTTVFAPALAAFQGLLLRLAPGTRVLAVGCPFNARTRVEFEGLIGFFVRSLPVVADVSSGADPTFDALTVAARDAMLAAHEHQELAFSEIVQLAGPHRDLAHNPVFQVWFDLAVPGRGDGRSWLDGLTTTPFRTGLVRTRFDLEMHLVDEGVAGLTGRLIYAADLFDQATAAELVGHFERFVVAAAHQPQGRLSRIPLIPVDELETIVHEWAVGGRRVRR